MGARRELIDVSEDEVLCCPRCGADGVREALCAIDYLRVTYVTTIQARGVWCPACGHVQVTPEEARRMDALARLSETWKQ